MRMHGHARTHMSTLSIFAGNIPRLFLKGTKRAEDGQHSAVLNKHNLNRG